MPARPTLRPAARRDLIDIWLFISAENEPAADKVLTRIEETLEMLSAFPQAGRVRSELHKDIRSFVSGSYVIFYTYEGSTLDVVRVLHGRADIQPDDLA